MSTILIAALFQIASPAQAADTPITLQLAAPSPASVRVRLALMDNSGALQGERTIAFEKSKASATVPANVVSVRAMGPEIFSESGFLRKERPIDLLPLPTGIIRLDGVSAPEGLNLTLFAFGSVTPDSSPAAWDVVEIAHGKADGQAWTKFRLPAGHYAFAVERGPSSAVLLGEAQITPGQEAAVEARPIESRKLVVRVLEGVGKKSVKGARLVEISLDTPNRALTALLARRAGTTAENGLLDLGFVPAASPSRVRVSAPGFRIAMLKLGALFEEGRRDVVLAPNQDVEVRVTGLGGRRGETRPEVSLGRCRYQRGDGNCAPSAPTSRTLDENGRARYARVDGGYYQVELKVPGLGKTRQIVEVASEGDAEALVVEMALVAWTFRGAARLHSGAPVSAQVRAMEWVNSRGEGTAAETTSSEDGTFELKLVSQEGHKIGLSAKSEDPPAETTFMQTLPLAGSLRVMEGIELELDSTGLEIAIRDAHTNEPVRGCPVDVTWVGKDSGNGKGVGGISDSDGFVRAYGLAEGSVRATVHCEKFYSKDLGELDIVRDAVRHVDVLVEESRDLVLVASGEDGGPVAGATIFIVSPSRMRGVQTAGTTDAQGELRLRGDEYGGETAFVIAPGRALAIQILPAPASCDRPEDCRVPVLLRNPLPFAGLAVRTESGEPLSLYDLGFSGSGISIPAWILRTLLSVNGLPADVPAVPLEVPVTSFFPPGAYVVTSSQQKPDPRTQKLVWTDVSLGAFNIPLLEKVELLDPDGPPSAKAQEHLPAVAAR
jgi:hypothetical protein